MNARPMHLAERILRYGIAGVAVSITYTLLVMGLVRGLPGLGPICDAALACVFMQPLALLLHGTITYPETSDARIYLPKIGRRFVITNFLGFAVSIGGMAFVTLRLHDSYLWGIVLAGALVPAINFVIYFFWVFRPARHRHMAVR